MNAWDMLPPPDVGELDEEALYASIGRALTHWEKAEAGLAILFGQLIAPGGDPTAAQRCYGTLGAFSARAEMLEEAKNVFVKNYDYLDWIDDEFKQLRTKYRGFVSRRNEIAHGVVVPYRNLNYMYGEPYLDKDGYCIVPADYSTSKRTYDRKPKYVYNKKQIDFYRNGFDEIELQARNIYVWVYKGPRDVREDNLEAYSHLPEEPEGT